MTDTLKPEQIASYRNAGYLFPLDLFGEASVEHILSEIEQAKIEAEAAGLGDSFADLKRSRAHMTMPFVCEIASNAKLLDTVASILGPNLMLWGADFFIKKAHSDKIVSWHQDLTYWGLGETDNELTAWLALSDITIESGCMRFVPGSHKQVLQPHRDTFDDNNLLSRGQEISVKVDENDAVDIVLKPGQLSFHHGRLFHASGPNRSDQDRVGLALRYITPEVKQLVASRDYATMMRGVDRSQNWNHTAAPSRNFDPDDLKLRETVVSDMAETLSAKTNQQVKDS